MDVNPSPRTAASGLDLAGLSRFVVGNRFLSEPIKRLRYQPQQRYAPTTGVLAGLAISLLKAGDPPINAYLLIQPIPPCSFITTAVIFFVGLNLVQLPSIFLTQMINAL